MPDPKFGSAGEALWRSYVEVYDLDATELALLEQGCRVKDELARIDGLISQSPPLLAGRGSMGQATLRPNPLYEEARRHRQLLRKLLSAIKLPAVKPQQRTALANVISLKAAAAADARWRRSRRGESQG